jgi:hypothetical protein
MSYNSELPVECNNGRRPMAIVPLVFNPYLLVVMIWILLVHASIRLTQVEAGNPGAERQQLVDMPNRCGRAQFPKLHFFESIPTPLKPEIAIHSKQLPTLWHLMMGNRLQIIYKTLIAGLT